MERRITKEHKGYSKNAKASWTAKIMNGVPSGMIYFVKHMGATNLRLALPSEGLDPDG
jgi:hypothetical protein